MNFLLIFIGVFAVVFSVAMWFRYRDLEEEELVEKSPGVHYKVWYIRTLIVFVLALGLFALFAALVS